MPEQKTIARARKDARKGKSASTRAGEFVPEETNHVRQGKHGGRPPQRAIARGLSKARRAGVKLGAPKGPIALRKKPERDAEAGENRRHKTARRRSQAVSGGLKREPNGSASRSAISRQTKKNSAKPGKRARSEAALKAARTRRAA